jgi:hypothetical protein
MNLALRNLAVHTDPADGNAEIMLGPRWQRTGPEKAHFCDFRRRREVLRNRAHLYMIMHD